MNIISDRNLQLNKTRVIYGWRYLTFMVGIQIANVTKRGI